MSYTKEDILRSMRDLNNEINACIDNIMLGRGTGNRTLEGNALFKMESIMVGTQQNLSVWMDFLQEETGVKDKAIAFVESNRDNLDYIETEGGLYGDHFIEAFKKHLDNGTTK